MSKKPRKRISDRSTSSAGVSPARISPALAAAKALLGAAQASGMSLPGLSTPCGPAGSSSKTLQAGPAAGSMPYVPTYNGSTFKRYRSLCRRAMLARRTGEPECSLLPTPTVGDAAASGSRCSEGSSAHPGVSLTDVVVHGRTLASHGPRSQSGRLSPRFVEWLMGLPLGWTEPVSEP